MSRMPGESCKGREGEHDPLAVGVTLPGKLNAKKGGIRIPMLDARNLCHKLVKHSKGKGIHVRRKKKKKKN